MSTVTIVPQIIAESNDPTVKAIWMYTDDAARAFRVDVVNGQRIQNDVTEDEYRQLLAYYEANGFEVSVNFRGHKVKPVDTDWLRLTALIKAQPAIEPRGHVKAGLYNGCPLILSRTSDDKLRGYFAGTGKTFHIGYWGRDHSNISSSRSGMWKVSDNAEQNFAQALACAS